MAAKKTTQTTKKAEDVKINAPVKTVETVKTETVAPYESFREPAAGVSRCE